MFINYVDQENANGNLSTMLTNQQLYYNDMMNKMSVTKLRDIVLEKKLTTDTSKLKKLDLLKLLEL